MFKLNKQTQLTKIFKAAGSSETPAPPEWTDWESAGAASGTNWLGGGTAPAANAYDGLQANDSIVKYAYESINAMTVNGNDLIITDFGFSTSGTILAVELTIHEAGSAASGVMVRDQLYLRNSSGDIGDNEAGSQTLPTNSAETAYEISGWNVSSLTPAIVNSSDFGLRVRYKNILGPVPISIEAQIYYLEMRIQYQ